MRSVSLPIHRPWAVATRAKAPTPRSRPGVQDRGRPLTGSRAAMPSGAAAPGPAVVGREAVVHPALVAADVDRGAGDGHAVEGVAAGVVDPGRLLPGAGGAQPPARGGVAQAAGPGGPGGPDH